jgi:Ni,Fe-hydrogenase III large subunit
MAVGALVTREQVFVGRVVLVDEELVREVEADAAERITGSRRLRNMNCAVGILRQLEADALERLRVLLQRRQIFFSMIEAARSTSD